LVFTITFIPFYDLFLTSEFKYIIIGIESNNIVDHNGENLKRGDNATPPLAVQIGLQEAWIYTEFIFSSGNLD